MKAVIVLLLAFVVCTQAFVPLEYTYDGSNVAFAATENALPTAVFHGMGDACFNPGMKQFTKHIGDKTGTYAVCLSYGEFIASFTTDFDTQVKKACAAVQADKNLQGEFNVVGLSHGGLVARYIVEKCELKGRVSKMVTFGGPHQGVASIPRCTGGTFCKMVDWMADQFVYTSLVQEHLGPAAYFKAPSKYQTYLEKNIFLPDLNNEKTQKDTTAAAKLAALDKALLIQFSEDTMVIPKESEWFGWYAPGENVYGKVIDMEDTDLYKEDWIGLQKLDKAQKVLRWSIKGNHLQFTMADVDKVITEVLLA